jgi:hypothetical protein
MVDVVVTRKWVSMLLVLKVELKAFSELGERKEVFGVAGATEVVMTPGWRTMILKTMLKTGWIVLGARHQVMHYKAAQRLTSSNRTKVLGEDKKTPKL